MQVLTDSHAAAAVVLELASNTMHAWQNALAAAFFQQHLALHALQGLERIGHSERLPAC
jgi:hypothetical protein